MEYLIYTWMGVADGQVQNVPVMWVLSNKENNTKGNTQCLLH